MDQEKPSEIPKNEVVCDVKSSTKKKKYSNLTDFLIKHRHSKKDGGNKQATHTRIGDESSNIHGGSYFIDDDEYDVFMKIYFNEILKKTDSFISWTLHDSVMIDMKNQDKALLPQIVDVFGDTRFGKYVVNVSAGSNYGEMKKIK